MEMEDAGRGIHTAGKRVKGNVEISTRISTENFLNNSPQMLRITQVVVPNWC